MRDYKHYRELFENTETVGAQLLARAIHTVRTKEDTRPPAELVRAIKKHGEVFDRTEAIALLEGALSSGAPQDMGSKLRAIRDDLGMTRGDVEALAGIPATTIRWMESEDSNPSVAALASLAGAYGLTLVEIVQAIRGGENA